MVADRIIRDLLQELNNNNAKSLHVAPTLPTSVKNALEYIVKYSIDEDVECLRLLHTFSMQELSGVRRVLQDKVTHAKSDTTCGIMAIASSLEKKSERIETDMQPLNISVDDDQSHPMLDGENKEFRPSSGLISRAMNLGNKILMKYKAPNETTCEADKKTGPPKETYVVIGNTEWVRLWSYIDCLQTRLRLQSQQCELLEEYCQIFKR